jgi:hypothetical protein
MHTFRTEIPPEWLLAYFEDTSLALDDEVFIEVETTQPKFFRLCLWGPPIDYPLHSAYSVRAGRIWLITPTGLIPQPQHKVGFSLQTGRLLLPETPNPRADRDATVTDAQTAPLRTIKMGMAK